MSMGAFLGSVFYLEMRVNDRENSCEEDERAVSRTIWGAPAPTTRKRRESLFGRKKRSEAM
jgi:hypothetical protein